MGSIVINDRLMSGCTVALYGDQFVLSDVNGVDDEFLIHNLVFGEKSIITVFQSRKKTTYQVIYISHDTSQYDFILCEVTKNEPNNITMEPI